MNQRNMELVASTTAAYLKFGILKIEKNCVTANIMKIEIDYNGAFAICKIDGRPFNYCKHEDQVFCLSAFRCIKEHYKREVKLGRIKSAKQEEEEEK